MEVTINGVNYVPAPDIPIGNGIMDALDVRFNSDAGDNITIRDYLRELLITLWKEGESFSGKRPFGNSGWQYDLYKPLIAGGFIPGELDEDGYVAEMDAKIADKYVYNMILAVFSR